VHDGKSLNLTVDEFLISLLSLDLIHAMRGSGPLLSPPPPTPNMKTSIQQRTLVNYQYSSASNNTFSTHRGPFVTNAILLALARAAHERRFCLTVTDNTRRTRHIFRMWNFKHISVDEWDKNVQIIMSGGLWQLHEYILYQMPLHVRHVLRGLPYRLWPIDRYT
jgi:hypothetical protein